MMRSRTYEWSDPIDLATSAKELDGIDFLQKILDGELPAPPVAETTAIRPTAIGEGWATFQLSPEEWHYNTLGTVHGGVLSTLADSALGCAVHSRLRAGTGYTSLDLVIKFTRPATTNSGVLTCTGEVVTLGRRVATAEARITDVDGKVIAVASSTCLIIPGARD